MHVAIKSYLFVEIDSGLNFLISFDEWQIPSGPIFSTISRVRDICISIHSFVNLFAFFVHSMSYVLTRVGLRAHFENSFHRLIPYLC